MVSPAPPTLLAGPAAAEAAQQQVAALGDVVTVWAHPDDESYLAAGPMAVAIGARVTCVTATAGELGGAGDRDDLRRQRTAELRDALRELAVTDHVLLGLPDGGCAAADPEPVTASITQIIEDRRPHTVVTFGPDGFTGHDDHRAVSRWTTAAVERVRPPRPRLLFTTITAQQASAHAAIDERFEVFAPGLPATHDREDLAVHLQLGGRWLDRKVFALRSHASQTAGLIDAVGADAYRAWVSEECFVSPELATDRSSLLATTS